MSQPSVQGTVGKAPCPYSDCGQPNSFEDDQAAGIFESGHVYACDHCGREFEIAKTEMVLHVWLRPFLGSPRVTRL
jgi:hypothetical protein